MLEKLLVFGNRPLLNPKETIDECFGFKPMDYDILTNKKSRAKIFSAFSSVPFKFNIGVFFHVTHTKWNLSSSDDDMVEESKSNWDKWIVKPGRITVMFATNFSVRNHKLMTAWTLAHRIMHAIHASKAGWPMHASPLDEATNAALYSIAVKSGCISGTDAVLSKPEKWRDSFDYILFSNVILTMKSARLGMIVNPLDITAEILAQYIICGKVRLNRIRQFDFDHVADIPDTNRSSADSKQKALLTKPDLSKADIDLLDAEITSAEEILTDTCKTMLASMVGKTFSF